MTTKKRLLTGGLVGIAGLAAVSAVAASNWVDDSEPPITGEAYEKASAAALAFTGGGRVSDTEQGDEDSYYEVEVTLEDGRQVDVQLDREFNVVGSEGDEQPDDD